MTGVSVERGGGGMEEEGSLFDIQCFQYLGTSSPVGGFNPTVGNMGLWLTTRDGLLWVICTQLVVETGGVLKLSHEREHTRRCKREVK